ncbi:MAG: FMN-binding protein [Bacteroidales bacterium]|nr:FMN-binding protein [Bacteroidales bacterium]MCM1147116.1 FMN-binding protein [Bacteroidales bacterium]MCM1205750.1 FMN-binding protein [Bacillota bacterium]MCM1511141.1 FMN-binding protein [Clostridium sp.]
MTENKDIMPASSCHVRGGRGKAAAIFGLMLMLCSLTTWADGVMNKQADGTYVVRTSTICNARGYRKGTPVEVHIKNNTVIKVTALKNEETVPYFARIKKFLLPLYENLKVSKAKKLAEKQQVDGCTGATMSLKAVQKNVKAALDYYEKNK